MGAVQRNIAVVPEGPAKAPPSTVLELTAHLARKNLLNGSDLAALTADDPKAAKSARPLFAFTGLSAEEYADELAAFFKMPRIQLSDLLTAGPILDRFSYKFLRENLVFPCELEGRLSLVVSDPTDQDTIKAAQLVLGANARLLLASFDEIATALSHHSNGSQQFGNTDEKQPQFEVYQSGSEDVEGLRDLASGAPTVSAVNDLFERAIELRATDIHIEPFRTGLAVRLRIDGIMRDISVRSDVLPQALLSRIKILSGLNIAERRLPQDGAAHVNVGGSEIDFRVATMPTKFGESAVVRLLPKNKAILNVGKLGLSGADQTKLTKLLELPHGMLVVTGPTGSGKTTTLATMLHLLNDRTRKILTIEDPIEYEIEGVNQTQVRPEIGLTFAAALRSFVRQDPDVIMVGEIRDDETARIAIHAALTGHLVLTTLHTETAAAAIPRLLDLGVEPFLLRSTLRGVIAQRLARLLCERCRRPKQLTADSCDEDPRFTLLGFNPGDEVYTARGCEHCSKAGYRGRTGLFEILAVSDRVGELISTRSDALSIAEVAKRAGMTTLLQDGIAKCRTGLTSVPEVLRVAAAG